MVIREARESDKQAALDLLGELQEHERQFEPTHLPAHEMAPPYFGYLERECRARDGLMYVAEVDGAVVGFMCVWRKEQVDEYMSQPFEIAYVSDLVVSKANRKQGIGTTLLTQAETFARERGLRMVKIGALSRNQSASDLYRKLGYRDYAVKLIKEIR